MVVGKNKILWPFTLALTLMFSAPITFAEEQVEKDKYKEKVISVVREEGQIATIELEEAIGKCDEEEKVLNLDALDFKGIDISHEEMMRALVHLSFKANKECVTEAKYKNFSYALIKLRSVLKYYNDPEFEEINVDEFSILTHPKARFKEELKIKYNEIDPKQRASLERIPGLSKPFKPIRLLRKIESEMYGSQKTP